MLLIEFEYLEFMYIGIIYIFKHKFLLNYHSGANIILIIMSRKIS